MHHVLKLAMESCVINTTAVRKFSVQSFDFSLEEYFSGLFCYRLYIPPPKIFIFDCMIVSTYEKCELPLFLLTSHQMQLHHTLFGAYIGISTKDLL